MGNFYHIRLQYCSDKNDFKKKYRPETIFIVSKKHPQELEAEMELKSMMDGNGWYYIDNTRNRTVKFKSWEDLSEDSYKRLLGRIGDESSLMPYVFAEKKDASPPWFPQEAIEAEKDRMEEGEWDAEEGGCPPLGKEIILIIRAECLNECQPCQVFKKLASYWTRMVRAARVLEDDNIVGYTSRRKPEVIEGVRQKRSFWCKWHVHPNYILEGSVVPVSREEAIAEEWLSSDEKGIICEIPGPNGSNFTHELDQLEAPCMIRIF